MNFLSKNLKFSFNILLSQISTVNNQIKDIIKLNQIKHYLTKLYRGRASALGKPVRGQRTWSNAWTSYFLNKNVRDFISTTQKLLSTKKKIQKIDYRKIEKRVVQKKNNKPVKKKIKNKTWF